jgi:Phosphatidylinositol 3- and 4-kinase
LLTKRIDDLIEVIKSKLGEVTDERSVGESDSTGIKGVNQSFILVNKEGKKFLFKPANGEHTSKWRSIPPHSQYLRERAAYLISDTLGWNLVPHSITKTYKNEIGSLQDWVNGTTKSDKTLSAYSAKYIWESGLFDIIIGNCDRHSGNWLTIKDRPILIDHGYSMPVKADNGPRSVILSRFANRIWGKPIPEDLLSDIKKLKNKELQEHVDNLVGKEAYKLFNTRVDELINSGIAQVSNYRVTDRVKGTPPEK